MTHRLTKRHRRERDHAVLSAIGEAGAAGATAFTIAEAVLKRHWYISVEVRETVGLAIGRKLVQRGRCIERQGRFMLTAQASLYFGYKLPKIASKQTERDDPC